MIDFEEIKEGSSLGDGYTLEQELRRDRAGTFYAVASAAGERVLAKVAPGDGLEAEGQLVRWQRAQEIRHGSLLAILAAGRIERHGHGYIYAIFENPDDVLSAALAQGAFGEEEARAVEEAALAGLRCLHGHGLVHGAVDADHVFAVGEAIKLATDDLHESDDPRQRAEDLRQLRELVHRMLPGEAVTEAAAPAPPVVAEIEPPVVEVAPAAPMAAIRELPPARMREEPPEPRPFPKWIVAGLAILVAVLLALRYGRHAEPAAAVPPVAPVTSTAVENQAAAPPPANVPARPSPAARPSEPATWRVVAFTYRSKELAEKKAGEINRRWPDLRAAVFSPSKARSYYLVALGNRMTREEAVQLQRKAVRMGLPHDMYVQNYDE